MSGAKFWLDFGGIRFSLQGTSKTATFITAHGQIVFDPAYRYEVEDMNRHIKKQFEGYRIKINVENIYNAYADDKAELANLIDIINEKNNKSTAKLDIEPKYVTSGLNYKFRDMEIDSNISILDGKEFKCFQYVNMLHLKSKKLMRTIPTMFEDDKLPPSLVLWGSINVK